MKIVVFASFAFHGDHGFWFLGLRLQQDFHLANVFFLCLLFATFRCTPFSKKICSPLFAVTALVFLQETGKETLNIIVKRIQKNIIILVYRKNFFEKQKKTYFIVFSVKNAPVSRMCPSRNLQ